MVGEAGDLPGVSFIRTLTKVSPLDVIELEIKFQHEFEGWSTQAFSLVTPLGSFAYLSLGCRYEIRI